VESKVNPVLIARMMAMVVQRHVEGKMSLYEAFEPFRLFGSISEQDKSQLFLAEEVVATVQSLTKHLGVDLSSGSCCIWLTFGNI